MTRSDLEAVFREMVRLIPVSLAVREFMRLVTMDRCLPSGVEVLDVGCGDGSFWKVFPRRSEVVLDGVDLNRYEVDQARRHGVYRHVEVGDISAAVPERHYDVVVGNCSLEHIPNINAALVNIRRCLRPEGRLLLFVPAFGWTRELTLVRLLDLGSPRLSMAASGALDGFFQHHHLYDSTSWRLLVEAAGYEVDQVLGMGAPVLNKVFEANLGVAMLEFLYKVLRKRYPRRSFHRRLPGGEFFAAMAEQPVALGSPGIVEYLLEARPAAG